MKKLFFAMLLAAPLFVFGQNASRVGLEVGASIEEARTTFMGVRYYQSFADKWEWAVGLNDRSGEYTNESIVLYENGVSWSPTTMRRVSVEGGLGIHPDRSKLFSFGAYSFVGLGYGAYSERRCMADSNPPFYTSDFVMGDEYFQLSMRLEARVEVKLTDRLMFDMNAAGFMLSQPYLFGLSFGAGFAYGL